MTTTTKARIVAAILFFLIVPGIGFVNPALIIPTALGIAAILTIELDPQ